MYHTNTEHCGITHNSYSLINIPTPILRLVHVYECYMCIAAVSDLNMTIYGSMSTIHVHKSIFSAFVHMHREY